jgi:hypothetical protein
MLKQAQIIFADMLKRIWIQVKRNAFVIVQLSDQPSCIQHKVVLSKVFLFQDTSENDSNCQWISV